MAARAMLTMTVSMLWGWLVAQTVEMSVAEMTVIGPVGPLIWEGVPPNSEAKKPSIIAPVKPAKAPTAPMLPTSSTLITPNAWIPKAKANGKATIPAVNPPKISPFKFDLSNNFTDNLIIMNYK